MPAEEAMGLREIVAALRAGEKPAALDLDAVRVKGQTPLARLCAAGNVEDAALLLQHGANPDGAPGTGLHPLVCAMTYFVGRDDRAQIVELARAMLDAGLDVGRSDGDRSLLVEAAYYDLPELCGFLIANGADPELRTADGQTALEVARASGSADALRVLCEHSGEDFEALAPETRTTLADVFDILGSDDVDARDGVGHTPLHIAAELGAAHLVGELVELGADVDARDAAGETPLFKTLNGDIDAPEAVATIRALAEAGADLQARGRDGGTALDRARQKPWLRERAACLQELGED